MTKFKGKWESSKEKERMHILKREGEGYKKQNSILNPTEFGVLGEGGSMAKLKGRVGSGGEVTTGGG